MIIQMIMHFLIQMRERGDSGLSGGASVINLNSSSSYSNTGSRNYIMYCWREIEGRLNLVFTVLVNVDGQLFLLDSDHKQS